MHNTTEEQQGVHNTILLVEPLNTHKPVKPNIKAIIYEACQNISRQISRKHAESKTKVLANIPDHIISPVTLHIKDNPINSQGLIQKYILEREKIVQFDLRIGPQAPLGT